jgi:hypothetical protein
MSTTSPLWLLCHNVTMCATCSLWLLCHNVCVMFIVTIMSQCVQHVHCDYLYNMFIVTIRPKWAQHVNYDYYAIISTTWSMWHHDYYVTMCTTCSSWLLGHNEHNTSIVTIMPQCKDVGYMFIVTTMPQCVRHVHCDYYVTMCTTCSSWLLGQNEHSMQNRNY